MIERSTFPMGILEKRFTRHIDHTGHATRIESLANESAGRDYVEGRRTMRNILRRGGWDLKENVWVLPSSGMST